MPTVTVIAGDANTVDATIADGRILLDPDQLPSAVGWTLKPEGLCRDDACVPVRDRAALFHDERLDLTAVAGALGRPVVVDAEAGIVAVALDRAPRRDARQLLVAPDFELADLDGTRHRLSDWRGRKRLLHAFSSW
jgi:hypothetical protein